LVTSTIAWRGGPRSSRSTPGDAADVEITGSSEAIEGAAEGLRQRVGLSAWPHLRRLEADLVAQVRQRLGDSQFDQAFAAGSRLTQRQAVDIVRDETRTGTQTP
jgi:hypothetical protein